MPSLANAVLLLTLAVSIPPQSSAVPTRVTIQANGQWTTEVSGEETVRDCATFRPTARQVRDYFAAAIPVDTRAYNHDLSMSRCHARGSARFGNRPAEWRIDRARRGMAVFANGERRYFYCVTCPAPPFEPVSDEDRAIAAQLIKAQPTPPR